MSSRKPSSSRVQLKRGSACLCCRRRKLKCDGLRPLCTQCKQTNRIPECQYHDEKQKSRTERLEERLSLLQQRLGELEPGSARGPMPSSQFDAEFLHFRTTPHSSVESRAVPFGFENYPGSEDYNHGPIPTSPAHLSLDPQDPWAYENRRNFLDIFITHRHQCGFNGQTERFSLSNTQTADSVPHPALMNAIYLLGCHFSHSPHSAWLGSVFFARTLEEISVALRDSDRLVDIVQASCLLSVYLYMNGRTVQGYTHLFSAARLAVDLHLHQILPRQGISEPLAQDFSIPAAQQRTKLADCISAFWQVFTVDRCWAVANGVPVALPDSDNPELRISTPWPMPESRIEEELSSIGRTSSNTIGALFEHQPMLTLDLDAIYMPSLRAKAVALYELTYRLGSSPRRNDEYWANYRSTQLSLQQFSHNLPMFVGYESWRTEAPLIDVDLFAVHTMMHVSVLHLYHETPGREELHAGNSILALIRQLNPGDYEYLDPILSACWTTTCRAYIRMMGFSGQQIGDSTMYPMHIIERELNIILTAMRMLSAVFPISGTRAMQGEEEAAYARAHVRYSQ
ncbi:adenylate kinase [Favolaschia claudopus]|uniref:Adenylate kinase n=1 Tax=Favolaschia claudopus TaxID=2862362 RepID=A0AAW0B2X0_9AGAR